MVRNHVEQALRAGKPQFGALLNFGDALVAEMMAAIGFDWLLVDTEHGPIDLATLATMFSAITRYPVAPNDFCASMGLAPSLEPPHREFEEAMPVVLAAARRHGVAPGIHCATPETSIGVNDRRLAVNAGRAIRDAVQTERA